MSKVQIMRGLVNQRLTAAAEEIFELFERTIAEYEEQLRGTKEENQRQQRLLDAVYNPEVRLHRADFQQLVETKEEVSPEQQERSYGLEQQERSSGLDQEDPPEPAHIKEEQEELWSSQEREQLQGLEEADFSALMFTPVPVKREEDDGEKPQSSQLHEIQTEEIRDTGAGVEDCGGSEPNRNFYLDGYSQPAAHVETPHFSQCENNYMSWYFDPTRRPQSGFNPLQNQDLPVSGFKCKTEDASVSSSAASFCPNEQTPMYDRIQTGEKPFVCSVCGQRYRHNHSLNIHMRLHSEGKHVNCPVCKKSFLWQAEVERHMRTHTGEKPFSCQFCGMRFSVSSNLNSHLQVHTGEKPFSCSVCKTRFRRREGLERHMKTHTGEKPYSCSICGKRFIQHVTLKRHVMVHTGEKPYGCSVCDKKFSRHEYVKNHKCVGESGRNT